MNLSTRLTLTMVTLVLLTAALAGVVTYRNLSRAVLPGELGRLRAHVQRQGARLDEVVSLARNDVLAFATGAAALDGIVRARLNGGIDPQDGVTEQVWRARMARRFATELQTKPDYTQFRLIGVAAGGREILRVDRSGSGGAVRVVPEAELQAKGDRDYFIETLKLPPGAVRLSKIDLNQEQGKIVEPYQPVIRASSPVYTAAGELFGILIINVDLRQTFARLGVAEHAGGQVYLVNEQGYYLLHPQPGKTFGFDLGRPDRLQADYPELAGQLGGTETTVRLMNSSAGESIGVAMLPLHPGGGPWLALVEMVPEAQLLAPLALVERSSLLTGGAVALLAAGLAAWLSRSLTNPLGALTRTVESFSTGKGRPEKVATTGEIGLLARAFENMQLEVGAKTEALRRSEHRFRALLEHSSDGIALIDADNKILYLSPSVSVIEGYAPEELIGRNGTENTHPEDLPLVDKVVQQLVANPGQPVPVLWRRRHKDGRWVWLEGVATNLLADPAVGAIVTNYRDVTERKRSEAAAARLAAIVEYSDDAVVSKDLSGIITSWNAGAEKVFGYPAPEMVGQSITRLIPLDRLEEEKDILARIREGKSIRHFDTVRLRKDGSAVDVSVTVSAIKGPDGSIIGASKVARDITERKRIEARFHRLVDSNAQGVIFWNTQGEISEANDAFLDMVGYTREDLKAGRLGWAAMTPPEYAALDQQALAEIAAKGVCLPFEKEYIRKDGSRVPILLGAAIFEDTPGEGVCFVLDITARRQAAEALRVSETRYRTLFEYAPDGIVIADQQSYYLDANTSMCRMLGYTRDQLIGLHASDIVAHQEIPHIGEALSVLETRVDYQREWEFRRKDGASFSAEVIATKMPDGNLLALIRDITERKRIEAALRASEERFRFLNELIEETRTLADPALIMAVMAGLLGEHLRASRCAYADVEKDGEMFTILHDYTDGCASTVGSYQLSLFGARAVLTLHSGQTLIIRDVEAELLPGEGADMFKAIGIKAIITCPLVKEGVLRAMMAVHQTSPRDWQPDEIALVQDVVERCWSTIERRTAEENIRRLNAELEQRVIERTTQLEAANKELEAFSYSVSHDLRAPLRAVDGFSQAVLQDFGPQLPDEGRRQLQTIRQSAQRMGALIDDLLTFSRLGRQALKKRTVDTRRLVEEALKELGCPRPDSQVEIRTGELPSCLGDAALLKQVWLNLLDNALKYSSKRTPAIIEIGSERRAEGLVYFVRDNGTGFDMQYAGKLFGVFQRLHRMEDYEGTGVGLATVQRIIHRHGGRIWAEAAPDCGATFYFTLNGEN